MRGLFLRFVLRPMGRERGRSILTVLGVMLGVAVMLGIQLANEGSLRGFSAALEAVSGKAGLEVAGGPLGVPEERLRDLAWLRDYGVATPVLDGDVMAKVGSGTEMLRVVGVDVLRDPALRDYALVSGGTESAGAVGSVAGLDLMALLGEADTLLLTESFATRHKLAVGDALPVAVGDGGRRCVVKGIIGGEGGAMLGGQSLAIMDIANAQVLLDRAGWVDRVELRLKQGLKVEEAEAAVRERLPQGLMVQRPQRRGAAVEKMLAAFHFNLTMLSGIALVVGVFLIYNTVSVAVMTRRREIGMLRTLGVGRGQVLRLFLGEAVLLGTLGALLGVPLAKGLALGAVRLTATTVDTLYVATAAQVPGLGWGHWALAFGVALPLAILAALLPAREAAAVMPVEAMRSAQGEMEARAGSGASGQRGLWGAGLCLIIGYATAQLPAVGGLPLWAYFSCLCAVVGMALVVPVVLRVGAAAVRGVMGRVFGIEGRLAVSQIRASTHRLSISVAALSVSLALTVAIAVMVGSFRETVVYWVDQTLGADLYVRPGKILRGQNLPAFSEEVLGRLRGHPQVEATEGYKSMDMQYGDRMVKLGTGDFAVQVRHGRLALKTRGDAAQLIEKARVEGAVLVSESFALRFGVREGDSISLLTKSGERPFKIAAMFYDYSNDSGTIMMDRALFENWFGESRPTHVALYLKPGADADQVRDDLLKGLGAGSVVSIFTNSGLRTEVLRIFDSTFAITWALEVIAVLVAMAGVAATMMTLVLERREEIRLLRIAGAEIGQVRRTIVLESGLLGAVSQGLGIVVGVLLSLVLIYVINPQSFGWSIQFAMPWSFLLGGTVLTVVGTMLAGLWPAHRSVRGALVTAVVLVGLWPAGISAAEPDWEPARKGYAYAFPRDHGQHPGHKIEWWYLTGNVTTAEGRRFGYQLTFFRIGAVKEPVVQSPWALRDVWMAHLAVTDVAGKTYHHGDRLNRAGPGLAGANETRVWNEDWLCEVRPVQSDGAPGGFLLEAREGDFGLKLTLDGGRRPTFHGAEGISQKGPTEGNASHYYSLTRMPTKGRMTVGGQSFEVTGESWMDHEFGSSFLEKGTDGWDWFSIQLGDGRELMLFQLRGAVSAESSAGTLIQPDGLVQPLKAGDFKLTPGKTWKSPSGAEYPLEWQIEIPKEQVSLKSRAVLPNQEFRAEATPGLGYWEGAVDYSGTVRGQPVTGHGYLEMTGYSGKKMSVWFGER